MLDAGYWMLDVGYWILDTGFWPLVAGNWFWLPIAGSGCRGPDSGWWKMAGIGVAAGLKSGQLNRKRNSEKANIEH
jgi:hypothetical protein